LILIHEKFSWQKYYKLLVVQNFLTKIYSTTIPLPSEIFSLDFGVRNF